MIRNGPKNNPPEVEEKACRLYVEEPELTARMIAERIGVNVSTIYAWTRGRGLSRKHFKHLKHLREPYRRTDLEQRAGLG